MMGLVRALVGAKVEKWIRGNVFHISDDAMAELMARLNVPLESAAVAYMAWREFEKEEADKAIAKWRKL